jgi:hypothetical protein
VITPNEAEVVRFAGGWLFDQAMAGWDVTVLSADRARFRSLRILGARAVRLETVLAAPVRGPRPRAIAVHAELYASHPRVQRMVRDALGGGATETRLWGGRRLEEEGADPVCHRLSMAAQAFKAQALAAVFVSEVTPEPTELFWNLGPLRPSSTT